MKKLLVILLFTIYTHAAYIETAIVACQTLQSIKSIHPHINKNSNKFHIPQDCLILTHNAEISVSKLVEEDYIEIIINDLNLKMFTIKSLLNTI